MLLSLPAHPVMPEIIVPELGVRVRAPVVRVRAEMHVYACTLAVVAVGVRAGVQLSLDVVDVSRRKVVVRVLVPEVVPIVVPVVVPVMMAMAVTVVRVVVAVVVGMVMAVMVQVRVVVRAGVELCHLRIFNVAGNKVEIVLIKLYGTER